MCQCTPEIKTPWCGKPGCQPPAQATAGHCWHERPMPVEPTIWKDKLEDGRTVQTKSERQKCCLCGESRDVARYRELMFDVNHGPHQPETWGDWKISDTRGGKEPCRA
jgi:hypothetical protein